jgi:hypothetical protein
MSSITISGFVVTLPDGTKATLPTTTVLVGGTLPGGGGTGGTGSTTPQTKSVFDFGAVGDGVTDDSGAFRAALVYAAANGRMVKVPGFTYAINSTISFLSAGDVGTVWGLFCEGATLQSKITNGTDVMSLVSHNTVRYFRIIGGLSIKGTGTDGNGLNIFAPGGATWFYNFLISGLSVEGVGKAGLLVAGNSFESVIENSYFQDNHDGAQFMKLQGGIVSTIHISNCFFNQNANVGITCGDLDEVFGGTTDVRISGGYIRQNGSFGALFNNGNLSAAMWGVGFENNCTLLANTDPNSAHVRSINDLTMYACQGGGNTTGRYLAWVFGIHNSIFDLCAMNTTFASKLVRAEGQTGAKFTMRGGNTGADVDLSAGLVLAVSP